MINKFKQIKRSSAAALLLLLLAGSACNKVSDFGDINNNPAVTGTPITAALLTNVISTMGGNVQGPGLRGGLYCQYMSETQYTEASLYATPQFNFDGFYAGQLIDLQNIILNNTDETTKVQAAASGSNNNQIAVARILKAYHFMVYTDQFGDIPYSESLKGNAQPKYDRQEDIYKDLFKELKEASVQFDNGPVFKGDILLKGDNTHWKKFANSLRLIMALRLSKVNPTLGTAEFNAALTDAGPSKALLINSNAENVRLEYPGGPYKNPWYNLYDGRKDQAVSTVLMNAMSTLNDPRITAYGSSSVGFPYGLTRDQAVAFSNSNPSWAKILSDSWRAENSAVPLLTYAQVLFARAEAAQRGWTTENTGQLYADAIRASFEQWSVYNAGSYASYIANSSVDLSGGESLKKICTQRWLALYPNCIEGWSEWRRTGYPELTPSVNATNSSKQIPRRFTYGINEYSLNEINAKEAASRIAGGDTQDGRMWWDKQ
jgi:hypothetical protein